LYLLETALRPDGHFMLAEPNRPVARDFFRLLRDHGFRYERSTQYIAIGGERHAVSIYYGSRKQATHDLGS
jgi:hypothetical protein